MKANWKFAPMGLAALAIIACNKKDEPKDPNKGGNEQTEYVKPISVADNSLEDWKALPAEFVFDAVCPADAAMLPY